MGSRFALPLMAVVAVTTAGAVARAEVTADQVRTAIERAQQYLLSQQSKVDGSWSEHPGQPGGVTALCTLALLSSGLKPDHPAVARALDHLRGLNPKMTYSTALQTMVFCAAEPERDMMLIRRNVRWLEEIQITRPGHPRRGAWAYSDRRGNGDNSNSQFAIMALHEADRIGVKVSERTWRLALNYWLDSQRPEGAWGYFKGQPPTGSMTCAGISALIITMDKCPEYARDAEVGRGGVRCCGHRADTDALDRAIAWLSGDLFTVRRNPVPLHGGSLALARTHVLYYLYGLERVGRLSGQRFFGRHDWYREGAEFLIAEQDPLAGFWVGVGGGERNRDVATALALLFLSKGRRPVVMAKYKYAMDNRWDLHRRGVQQLVLSLEPQWDQLMSWQTIDAEAATVNDLLESPVLFISGQGHLDLTPQQKLRLRQYVEQGGFIFAEACNGDGCDGTFFDQDFRRLVRELFPESQLRPLPPDHPIWHAERKVVPDRQRWLWGLDACCRTSVVYCPSNLSCYWQLNGARDASDFPKAVQHTVDECLAIGQNVLAYATNRRVKAKLERPKVIDRDKLAGTMRRGVLTVAKLSHAGGANDAPNALANLLAIGRHELDMKMAISLKTPLVPPDDPALLQFPFLFIHGRRQFSFTADQREGLATYLRRGGFLFGDAICSSREFAEAFRRQLQAALPEAKLQRIASDHPLLTQQFGGYDITTVTLRSPESGGEDEPLSARYVRTAPVLEGLLLDGRLAVIFSPYDLSCALENQASMECKGYTTEDAARIGLNILLYALQQ